MRTKAKAKPKRVLKKAPPRKKAMARKPIAKMAKEQEDDDPGPSYETLHETVIMLSNQLEELQAKHNALVETSQFDLHKYKKWIGLLDAFRDGLEESQVAFETGLAELAGQITEPTLPSMPKGPREGEQRAFSDAQQQKSEMYQKSLRDPRGLYWVVARERWVTSGTPPIAKWRKLLWNGYQNGVVVATMDWCLNERHYRVWVGNTMLPKPHELMSDGFAAGRAALAAKQQAAVVQQAATASQVASIEAIEATTAAFSQKHAKA